MDIDNLIIKSMGWKEVYSDGDYDYFNAKDCVEYSSNRKFSPTTNIKDAYMVLDNFDSWQVTKIQPNGEYRAIAQSNGNVGFAKTPQMAICIASLKAIGIDVSE